MWDGKQAYKRWTGCWARTNVNRHNTGSLSPYPKGCHLRPASAQCPTGAGHSQCNWRAWSQGTFLMLVRLKPLPCAGSWSLHFFIWWNLSSDCYPALHRQWHWHHRTDWGNNNIGLVNQVSTPLRFVLSRRQELHSKAPASPGHCSRQAAASLLPAHRNSVCKQGQGKWEHRTHKPSQVPSLERHWEGGQKHEGSTKPKELCFLGEKMKLLRNQVQLDPALNSSSAPSATFRELVWSLVQTPSCAAAVTNTHQLTDHCPACTWPQSHLPRQEVLLGQHLLGFRVCNAQAISKKHNLTPEGKWCSRSFCVETLALLSRKKIVPLLWQRVASGKSLQVGFGV